MRRVTIDLTACYPRSLGLKTLVRHVWLAGNDLLVVADQIEAETPPQVTYHWHGNAACAWWLETDWAMVVLNKVQLWFTSPQVPISAATLQRLPGSRGQLTLVSSLMPPRPVIWWVFVIGAEHPIMHAESQGQSYAFWTASSASK